AMRTVRRYKLWQAFSRVPVSGLSQLAQRPQIDRQILVGQSECFLQLIHPVVQLQQREAKLLDLLITQAATIHSANGLMLQDAAQQFYHRKYKPRKTLLDLIRVGVDPLRKRVGERNKIAYRLFIGRV